MYLALSVHVCIPNPCLFPLSSLLPMYLKDIEFDKGLSYIYKCVNK